MRLALQQAALADAAGEVPVGAVLVSPTGEVLAAAHNQTEGSRDPTAHAELLCIRRGATAAGGWRLLDSTLYVTLEPCPMCAGAVLQSRVGALVYGARNSLLGADGSWIAMLPRADAGACGGAHSSGGSDVSRESGIQSSCSCSQGSLLDEQQQQQQQQQQQPSQRAPAAADGEAGTPARPHPFHPSLQVRRGVLADECSGAMRAFFARRRREAAAAAAASGAA